MLCKILMGVSALIFVTVTLVLFHLHTVPELYDGIHFKGVFVGQGFLSWSSNEEISIDGQEPGDRFALSKIESFSLFLNYVQVVVVLLFVVLILRKLMSVIRSTADRDLLARSRAFREIGHYLLAIFIVTSFTSVYYPLGHFSGVFIRLIPMLFVIGAYIAAGMLRKEHERVQSRGVGV